MYTYKVKVNGYLLVINRLRVCMPIQIYTNTYK